MFDIIGLIKNVSGILDKVIPDIAARDAAKANLQSLAYQGQLQIEFEQLQSVTAAQSDINKAEATNSSLFVAGWRPMIGWVCAAALGYQYLLKPLILGVFSIMHQAIPVMPGIDDQLWQLMFGMLGMGALRSFDKTKGVATETVGKKP